MADDENGKPPASGAGPAGHPIGTAAEMGVGSSRKASEWTASDERGPLAPAPGEDVERVSPGSGMDADGAIDRVPSDEGAHGINGEQMSTGAASSLPDEAAPEGALGTEARLAPVDTPSRSSGGAVLAGLLAGAVIGAVSAGVVYYALVASHAGHGGEASQTSLEAVQTQVGALSQRVAALSNQPRSQSGLDELKSNVAALAGKVAAATKTADEAKAASNKVADRQAAVTTSASEHESSNTAATGASAAPAAPAFNPAPMQQQIAALQSGLSAVTKRAEELDKETGDLKQQNAALQKRNDALGKQVSAADALGSRVGGLAAAVAGVQKQTTSQQSSLDGLQADQKTLAGKVTAPAAAVVADSLVQQVDAGLPYATQLNAAASLGADMAQLEPLRENAAKGVASAKTLAAELIPLVGPMIAADHRAPDGASFGDRLKTGLFGLVSVRRVDNTTGTDIRSRIARLQADLVHGDVTTALADYVALPADVRARSADWGAQLKTSADVQAAAKSLQQAAIAALAAKKS